MRTKDPIFSSLADGYTHDVAEVLLTLDSKRFKKLSRGGRSLMATLSQSNDVPASIQVTLTSSNLSVEKCGGLVKLAHDSWR